MEISQNKFTPIPLKELIKSVPGFFGIRLEEEPEYRCLRKEGAFEIRRYGRILMAQVHVEGEHSEAVDDGFHKLATYIFGDHSKDWDGEKDDQPMSMTTPVFQQQNHDGWIISFVLQSKYNLENVPRPLDPDVKLVEVQEKTVAVYQYSGNNTEERMRSAERELKAWLLEHEVLTKPKIRFAQYDAPFTIPFLKRNEVHIEVML